MKDVRNLEVGVETPGRGLRRPRGVPARLLTAHCLVPEASFVTKTSTHIHCSVTSTYKAVKATILTWPPGCSPCSLLSYPSPLHICMHDSRVGGNTLTFTQKSLHAVSAVPLLLEKDSADSLLTAVERRTRPAALLLWGCCLVTKASTCNCLVTEASTHSHCLVTRVSTH